MTASVIRRIDLRGADLSAIDLATVLPRAALDVEAALETVRPIVEAVRTRGDAALLDLARAVRRGTPDRPAGAGAGAREALAGSSRTCAPPSRSPSGAPGRSTTTSGATDTTTQVVAGGTVTERWVPVERVGLVRPGRTGTPHRASS